MGTGICLICRKACCQFQTVVEVMDFHPGTRGLILTKTCMTLVTLEWPSKWLKCFRQKSRFTAVLCWRYGLEVWVSQWHTLVTSPTELQYVLLFILTANKCLPDFTAVIYDSTTYPPVWMYCVTMNIRDKKLSYWRDSAWCVKQPFKVTQGHPSLCQSTWHLWLSVSTR